MSFDRFDEATQQEIIAEEKAESFRYMAFAGLMFFCAALLVNTEAHWAWYFKALFSVVTVAYYIGYRKCYVVFYEYMAKHNCMRHDAGYRMTDGHILALMYSIVWPLMWLGRGTVLKIKSMWRNRGPIKL